MECSLFKDRVAYKVYLRQCLCGLLHLSCDNSLISKCPLKILLNVACSFREERYKLPPGQQNRKQQNIILRNIIYSMQCNVKLCKSNDFDNLLQ